MGRTNKTQVLEKKRCSEVYCAHLALMELAFALPYLLYDLSPADSQTTFI